MERNIEGYTNYHITNDGRVYSFNQNKWKKIHIHRGRAMIKLSDGHGNMKNRSISRLVAKAYVPNPENKPYVLHLANKFGVHRKTLEHLQKKRAWYGL